jgi:hypothetical protein
MSDDVAFRNILQTFQGIFHLAHDIDFFCCFLLHKVFDSDQVFAPDISRSATNGSLRNDIRCARIRAVFESNSNVQVRVRFLLLGGHAATTLPSKSECSCSKSSADSNEKDNFRRIDAVDKRATVSTIAMRRRNRDFRTGFGDFFCAGH